MDMDSITPPPQPRPTAKSKRSGKAREEAKARAIAAAQAAAEAAAMIPQEEEQEEKGQGVKRKREDGDDGEEEEVGAEDADEDEEDKIPQPDMKLVRKRIRVIKKVKFLGKKQGGDDGGGGDSAGEAELKDLETQLEALKPPVRDTKGTERILAERGIVPAKGTRARILHNQKDYLTQKCALETLLNAAGHSAVFLPKFHSECNPIEMFWGYSKYLYRQQVKASLQQAHVEVLKAMNSCPGDVIRKYINRSFRFMGLSQGPDWCGSSMLWVVRKQKSPRRVSEAAMKDSEEHSKKSKTTV